MLGNSSSEKEAAHMKLTPAQRKIVTSVALDHITRFIEARDRKAIEDRKRRGWLRDKVVAIALDRL
jgi:hypothetical protein